MTGTEPEGARTVREEDAFDVDAVAGWLREHAEPEFGDLLVGTPDVHQFAGGASNLTYLLTYPERRFVLRRAPLGTKARGAHDMGREHRVQKALKPVFDYVPAMVAFCDDEAVLGSDFYVMEHVTGFIPRGDLPAEELSAEQARRLCLTMVDVLAELHAVDPAEAGLQSMSKGPGYVGRQVAGWSSRYRAARTEDAPDFEATMAWLDEHQPDDVATCVIHNDFKMDNLIFDAETRTEVIGVLDWEMATLGDPLMDLGGDLAFWVEAGDTDFERLRRVPTHLPGMITRAEFLERYCARAGLEVTPEQWRFYEVFGIFRLAVICQQIYYRFFHGQTTNEAFASFGQAAWAADARATRLLGWE